MNDMYWTTFSQLKKDMLSLVPNYISESYIDDNIADIQRSLIKCNKNKDELMKGTYLYRELINNCNNFQFMLFAISKNNKLSRKYLLEVFKSKKGSTIKNFQKNILLRVLDKKG